MTNYKLKLNENEAVSGTKEEIISKLTNHKDFIQDLKIIAIKNLFDSNDLTKKFPDQNFNDIKIAFDIITKDNQLLLESNISNIKYFKGQNHILNKNHDIDGYQFAIQNIFKIDSEDITSYKFYLKIYNI